MLAVSHSFILGETKMEKIVNELAEIKAEISKLAKREKELTNSLKASGAGTYSGDKHYVVISESDRETLDMKAVREKLTRQFIKAHTRVTKSMSARIYGYSQKMAA